MTSDSDAVGGVSLLFSWWHRRLPDTETAVIADGHIPSGVSSLPFVSAVAIRRLLHRKPVACFIKAYVSASGLLSIDAHLDWIPLVRVARNCHEQNVVADLTHGENAVTLQTTRAVESGHELKVWLSPGLLSRLQIAFLSPQNILAVGSYRCHRCGITFCQPNPLKIHLTFECHESNQLRVTPVPTTSTTLMTTSHTILPPLLPPRPALQNQPLVRPLHQNQPLVRPLSSNHSNGYSLGSHLKEAKTHSCLFCGKLYTRKYGLKIHLRTHTGQKPLQCRFCGRPFSDPSNLNKHIRLHSQQTGLLASPYKCAVCGKVLVRRRDLERHVKSRHQS